MTTTDPTPTLIATLPGAAYTDPAFFALEQERIFERLWFCAADGRKLTAPGDFATIEIGRESVIVSRAKDGSPRRTWRTSPTSTARPTASTNSTCASGSATCGCLWPRSHRHSKRP